MLPLYCLFPCLSNVYSAIIQFAVFLFKVNYDIVMVIIIFLFILTIIINILNYRIAKRWHYIELVVDKKLPIEAESRDAGASDDSCMIYHYPVEGRDSTSGYASIFYVGKEKYENAEVGEKIRITPC